MCYRDDPKSESKKGEVNIADDVQVAKSFAGHATKGRLGKGGRVQPACGYRPGSQLVSRYGAGGIDHGGKRDWIYASCISGSWATGVQQLKVECGLTVSVSTSYMANIQLNLI